MKKVLLIAAAMFVALGVTVGLAPAAQAYPELTCNVTVDAQIVNSGDSFTATGTSQQSTTGSRSSARAAAADEVTWRMVFNHVVKTGSGVTFSAKFQAPVVQKLTKFPLTATALMPDKKTTCSKTVDITVKPDTVIVDPPCSGVDCLPNAGGPRLLILIAGLVLILGGAVAVRQSRRKQAGTSSP